METISISKFKATCLAMIDRVGKTGLPLLVTKRGVPIAQVIPPPKMHDGRKSAFGSMAGSMTIVGDIVEPLFPEGWDESD